MEDGGKVKEEVREELGREEEEEEEEVGDKAEEEEREDRGGLACSGVMFEGDLDGKEKKDEEERRFPCNGEISDEEGK